MSLFILSGCASSDKNAPVNVQAAAETVVSENITEVNTDISPDETTLSALETTTKTAEEALNINSDIKAKANSRTKQPVSHAAQTVSKPKETTAPEGVRIIATSGAVCDIMDRLGLSLVGVPETIVSAIASRYNGVTTVGSPMSPDMEIIKSLNPTDVIGLILLKMI